MADTTRSDSDAASTLSVKTKRKQPFVLESFLSRADGGRTKAKYRKNEIIFRQGDSADAVFYIMDGKCKITVVSEKGKEAVVALHEKGDFFGEGCLTGQPRRLATVTAITASEIMRLDKATMVRVLHDEPKFSQLFMSHLLARNVRVEADLVDQLFNSSEKRLARLLLLMANFGKEGRPEPVIAKVSQETLAEMIGTTRSRVSFFMIAVLALCPLRLENLAAIRIGQHLTFGSARPRFVFAAEEMKGRRSLEFDVPTVLHEDLAFYLSDIHPTLYRGLQLGAPLWPSLHTGKSQMSEHGIYTRITQVTEKHLGQPISPHMFRDAAATFITELAPEHAMMAARVLQHASLDVTMRHYVHGQQHLAALKYHAAIDEIITRVAAETIGL